MFTIMIKNKIMTSAISILLRKIFLSILELIWIDCINVIIKNPTKDNLLKVFCSIPNSKLRVFIKIISYFLFDEN